MLEGTSPLETKFGTYVVSLFTPLPFSSAAFYPHAFSVQAHFPPVRAEEVDVFPFPAKEKQFLHVM